MSEMRTVPIIHHIETVDYVFRDKTYQVEDLKPGMVMSYDNSGYGDCSVRPFVVVSVKKKASNPNKGTINQATVSPIVSHDQDTVTYDSSISMSIGLYFYTLSSAHRNEGWNFSKTSLGRFTFGIINEDSGIMKG